MDDLIGRQAGCECTRRSRAPAGTRRLPRLFRSSGITKPGRRTLRPAMDGSVGACSHSSFMRCSAAVARGSASGNHVGEIERAELFGRIPVLRNQLLPANIAVGSGSLQRQGRAQQEDGKQSAHAVIVSVSGHRPATCARLSRRGKGWPAIPWRRPPQAAAIHRALAAP